MNNLNDYPVYSLKKLCKEQNYKGFSKCKNKKSLIDFIISKGFLEREQNNEEINEENHDEKNKLNNFKHVNENKNIVIKYLNENHLTKDIPHKNQIRGVYDINRTEIYNIYKRDKGKKEIVFHGTDFKNLDRILENGFCITNKVLHGNAYGNGIYFSKDFYYATKYPLNCNDRIVLVVEIWNKDIIKGNSKYSLPPLIKNTNIHYDTYVDNISLPNIFVKNNENSYNILGYIRVGNETFNRKQNILINKRLNIKPLFKTVTFTNNLDKNIMIYFVKKKNVNTELHNLSIKDDCKALNFGKFLNSNDSITIKTMIGHQFICGYFQSNTDNIIILSIFKITNTQNNYEINNIE